MHADTYYAIHGILHFLNPNQIYLSQPTVVVAVTQMTDLIQTHKYYTDKGSFPNLKVITLDMNPLFLRFQLLDI